MYLAFFSVETYLKYNKKYLVASNKIHNKHTLIMVLYYDNEACVRVSVCVTTSVVRLSSPYEWKNYIYAR